MKHTVFITGAAGYVGGMLVERMSEREDVALVIGLDKEPFPENLAGLEKLVYVCANTADDTWQQEVASYEPDVVIHTAWHIREIYGDRKKSWNWNIDGSDNVFDFVFRTPSVERFVHYSTVASYGAFKDNTQEHHFTEEEPFRKTDYLYAEEKRIAEEHLREKYAHHEGRVAVSIIRPAAITGPRGRFARIRFGLQASLAGSLKGRGSFLYDLISLWVSFVPVTKHWLRQYVHEDDIAAVTERVALGTRVEGYEIFNVAPPGSAVLGADMARAVGKRTIPIAPWMARLAFFVMWHISRGHIPTAPGSWKGYSYPIAVDGSKVERVLGISYSASSYDAFYYTDGRYEHVVPEHMRRSKRCTVIDGRSIAREILEEIKERAGDHTASFAAFVVGPSATTLSYLRMKRAQAERAGVRMEFHELPEDATTEDVIRAIQNATEDAIIVQLPLPPHIDADQVLAKIPESKDADVLSPLTRASGSLMHPIAAAIEEILVRTNTSAEGMDAVVVGQGWLVGQPVAAWLTKADARVRVVTKESNDLKEALATANIVVSGAGSPGLITSDLIKSGAVVIDVGTSELGGSIAGDVVPTVTQKARVYTPVPGGVGPIAVAFLMKNVVDLALGKGE